VSGAKFVRGWRFSHAIETCTDRHNAHGAAGQNLLETVQPVICLSCHNDNDF
jgi:predicted CXXCH cytochrome family protein